MQKFAATEKHGHAKSRDGANACRKRDEPRLVAAHEPAEMREKVEEEFKLRDRVPLPNLSFNARAIKVATLQQQTME
jgi:hypothetical protein